MCVRERVCVCACEREREREYVCERERLIIIGKTDASVTRGKARGCSRIRIGSIGGGQLCFVDVRTPERPVRRSLRELKQTDPRSSGCGGQRGGGVRYRDQRLRSLRQRGDERRERDEWGRRSFGHHYIGGDESAVAIAALQSKLVATGGGGSVGEVSGGCGGVCPGDGGGGCTTNFVKTHPVGGAG